MNKHTMTLIGGAVIALALWGSWLFRYDPSHARGAILDRWTGQLIVPGSGEVYDLRPPASEDQLGIR